MIDEADTVLHRNHVLRSILNAGYRRKTAYVVRVALRAGRQPGGPMPGCAMSRGGLKGEDPNRAPESAPARQPGTKLARYSSWCPKAIATIRRLPETLSDRCIVITMHRKKVLEKCQRVADLDATTLRRKCARFVADHADEITTARPRIPGDLNDRAAEIWEPLLALAELAGGEWPQLASSAAVALTASAQEETPVGALLFDILVCFLSASAERMFSRQLAAELNAMPDRPWGEMLKGKVVTELWLATQLRPYGILPKPVWIGELAARGYQKSDFTEVFQRYVPNEAAKRMLEELTAAAASHRDQPARETGVQVPRPNDNSTQAG
jgi:hypothetical protein